MRKFMIKMGIFIIISTYALFDYRMLSFQNNRLLIANWHQVSTWSEVESLVVDANQAEVYPSRAVRRSNSYDQKNVVIYLDNNFYNISNRLRDGKNWEVDGKRTNWCCSNRALGCMVLWVIGCITYYISSDEKRKFIV